MNAIGGEIHDPEDSALGITDLSTRNVDGLHPLGAHQWPGALASDSSVDRVPTRRICCLRPLPPSGFPSLLRRNLDMTCVHTWLYDPGAPAYAEAWPQIIEDTRRVLDAVTAAGIALSGHYGTGDPVTDSEVGIAFTESGPREPDSDTVLRLRPPGHSREVWGSCRTGGHPYDLAVGAVLLRTRLLLPGVFRLSSDRAWPQWSEPSDEAGTRSVLGLIASLFGDVPADSPFELLDY